MGIRIKISKRRNSKLCRTAALRLSLRARRCNRFDMRLVLHRRRMSFWERAARDFGRLRRRLAWAVPTVPTITVTNFRPLMRSAAAAMLILGMLNSAGLATISKTVAYFNDEELSSGNTFTAGSLNFSLSGADFSPATVNKGESSNRTINIVNDGSLGFQYKVSAVQVAGDGSLCNALELVAKLHGATQYTGALLSLGTPPTVFDSGSADWLFTVSLPGSAADSLQDKTCTFKFIFSGWQEDIPDASAGFSDTEEIASTVSSGHWTVIPPVLQPGDVVINEIMWMGARSDSAADTTDNDEWLELRNMTDRQIDLSLWKLINATDNTPDILEIPAGRAIAPNGFFLIANYNQANSWINVPIDYVKSDINFNNNYNTNGSIILEAADNTIIDKTPTPTSGNWPAGKHQTSNPYEEWSMERNLTPGDGILTGSWHTCDPTIMNTTQRDLMHSYWDSNAIIYNCGTPGAANLSANDPTAPDFNPSLVAGGTGLLLVALDVENAPSMPTDPQATAFPTVAPETGFETTPESLGPSDSGGNEDPATVSAVDEITASTTDATTTLEVLPSTTPTPAAVEPPVEPAILPEEPQPVIEPQTPPAITTEIVPAIESAPAPAVVEPSTTPAVEVAPPAAQNPAPAE